MYLRFSSSLIAAVAVARAPNGGEPGSGRSARRARKENEMVGILAVDAVPLKADRDPRALQAATAPTCMVNGVETEFVDCTVDGASCKQACLEACNGVEGCSCCVGEFQFDFYYYACVGFQGKVCPDGSCSGADACHGATIGYVVDGCQGGEACIGAAHLSGYIKEISSSCNAKYGCYYAASYGGSIQEITSSCNAERACAYAARLGGEIQEISSSCNAYKACYYAAYDSGSIQEISSSCNNVRACNNAARAGTIPNKIERCCNFVSACKDLAEDSQQDPDPDQCVKNAGKGCWAHCGETAGDCAYCGSGQCCRSVDFRNQVPGCELAENAQGARCGAHRGSGFPALMNVGLPCIGKCGKQPGDCDYCGTAGQCCRPFDGERCVPGCELASEDSWMGPGSQCGEFKDPSAAPVHCAPTP